MAKLDYKIEQIKSFIQRLFCGERDLFDNILKNGTSCIEDMPAFKFMEEYKENPKGFVCPTSEFTRLTSTAKSVLSIFRFCLDRLYSGEVPDSRLRYFLARYNDELRTFVSDPSHRPTSSFPIKHFYKDGGEFERVLRDAFNAIDDYKVYKRNMEVNKQLKPPM